MQGRQELVGGVGRATEVEEDIDPALARAAVTEPDKLLIAGSALIDDQLKCEALLLMFHIAVPAGDRSIQIKAWAVSTSQWRLPLRPFVLPKQIRQMGMSSRGPLTGV